MDDVQSGAPAPVVNEIAAPAAPAPEVTATPEAVAPEGGDKPEAPPEKQLPQSEVDRIVAREKAKEARRVEKAIREAARAEAERDFLRKQIEDQQRSQTATKGELKRADFDSDEAFYQAVLDRQVQEGIRKHLEQRERETSAQREQRESMERAQRMQEKLASGNEKYDDFEEKVYGSVPFTPPMVAYLEDSDMAVEVAYHLASNVKEAARIAALPPPRQIRELHDLETKLKAPPKTTQAPPPIVPNGTKTAAPTGYSPTMTDKQYAEWRERQKAQRRNR